MNKHLTYDEFYDCCQNYEMIYQNYFEQTKEIDRLNNIINELEEWLNNQIIISFKYEIGYYKEVLDKLKELKEDK